MIDSTELRNQVYQRMIKLCQIARQRYLEAGGDPRRSSGTLHRNDYLTDEEQQEFLVLGRKLSGFYIKDGYAHHLGKSWKLPDDSPLLKDEVKV
ncbi:MAG TPA: hypothetical protein DD379_11375 [Cyanobacteria bacterium UBA11162]|nr:hypothetical protein [Cyanobacteria bacterium UBA11162]